MALYWVGTLYSTATKAPARGFVWKKAVLKNFAIFTGKHLCVGCWSLFWLFSKVAGLVMQLYLKKQDSNTSTFEINMCRVYLSIKLVSSMGKLNQKIGKRQLF